MFIDVFTLVDPKKTYHFDLRVYFGRNTKNIFVKNMNKNRLRKFFRKNYRKINLIIVSGDHPQIVDLTREGYFDGVLNPPLKYSVIRYMRENSLFALFTYPKTPKDLAILKRKVKIYNKKKIKICLVSGSFPAYLESFKALARYLGLNPREVLSKNPEFLLKRAELRRESNLAGVVAKGVEEEA